MRSLLSCLIIGIISGSISVASIVANNELFAFWPGTIFAIAILILINIYNSKKSSALPAIGWTVISSLSYLLALYTSLFIGHFFFENNYSSGFIFGGSVGTAAMLLGFKKLVYPISWPSYFLLVVLGGLLSTTFLLPLPSNLPGSGASWVIWQTGMILGIMYTFRSKRLKQ